MGRLSCVPRKRLLRLLCVAYSVGLIACGGGSSGGSSTTGGGGGGGGATGGGGGGGGATAKPEMLYVASGSNGQGEILAYTIDPSSRQLSTPVSINAPSYLLEMHVDPTGKFLYASDFDMGAVRVYSINSSMGTLTEVAGSPFMSTQVTGNGGPLAASPDGKFLFYSNALGDIATFTVSSGVLTATAGVAPNIGQPSQMVVDPDGKFLYIANHADYVIGGQFSVFAIDSNTGALMEISGSPFSYQSNAEPSGIGMHPSGKFLYTALSNSAGVDGVSVNTATGALTLITGAPWSTGSFLPDYVAMAPSGSFLYVSQKGTGAVNAFTIDQTSGALTLVQTLDGGNPMQMVVDPAGKSLYASDTAFHGVSLYAIDQTLGSLGRPADVPAGDDPGAIAIVQLH
jgi:6-phosphogluconolactonase